MPQGAQCQKCQKGHGGGLLALLAPWHLGGVFPGEPGSRPRGPDIVSPRGAVQKNRTAQTNCVYGRDCSRWRQEAWGPEVPSRPGWDCAQHEGGCATDEGLQGPRVIRWPPPLGHGEAKPSRSAGDGQDNCGQLGPAPALRPRQAMASAESIGDLRSERLLALPFAALRMRRLRPSHIPLWNLLMAMPELLAKR